MSGGLAADLFRREIPRGAEEAVAGLGEPQFGRLVGADRSVRDAAPGQAEIEDLDDALGA